MMPNLTSKGQLPLNLDVGVANHNVRLAIKEECGVFWWRISMKSSGRLAEGMEAAKGHPCGWDTRRSSAELGQLNARDISYWSLPLKDKHCGFFGFG
ncbi:hypothetical protein ATANTOWER_011573, partial [Ataeniobius toweri]|nr:hypothetical protein [Ataeniobius toweri]